MKKVFLLSLFVTINVIAQNRDLGKVTVQELEEKICPLDSSAVASILFSIGDVSFDFVESSGNFIMNTNVKTKIKIYKKEGYEYANKEVRYYIGGSSKEKISFKNEVTYNLINGKIEKTKLRKEGEFDEKVNEFWGKKKISMPNVKEGSIVEFEYTVSSELIGSIDSWYFQSSIPTLYSEFNIKTPEFYVYTPKFRGFLSPKIVTEKNKKSISITSKARTEGLVTRTVFSTENFDYTENKTVYTIENIPAIKDEAFVNNIKNYISSIEHELMSVQYPNQPAKNFATDWETVVKKIYENEDFGNELNKTGYFEKDIDAILAGSNSQEEKIASIFTFVKSKMNWNEYYGYACNNGVRKAYQDKVGNAAEINLMLTSMLRYAGFEANPVLISTRGNGIAVFPSRNAFDYVITGVELNNQTILFDATNKYSMYNILPIRDLNWKGRLIRKNGTSSSINLTPTFNSKDVINLMAEINSQGEVMGKVREQYFDYNGFVYRDKYNGLTKETMMEKIEKKYQGLEISEYDVQNSNDLSKPIIENYSFTSNNVVETIGDKMYFSPFLHFAMSENPFKQESRFYPIDFVFPNQDKYSISIKLPEGYVVETLPEVKAIGLPNDYGNFKYNISSNGNQIQLMYTYDINTAIIPSENYEEIKAFFKEMINKQTEKVVLKKI